MGYTIIGLRGALGAFGTVCIFFLSLHCRAENCSTEYGILLIRDLDARDHSLVVQEKILATRQEVLRRDPPLVRDRRGNTVLDKAHAREILREILDEVKEANAIIAQLKVLEAARIESASGQRTLSDAEAALIRSRIRTRIEGVEGTIEKLKTLGKSILKFGDPYH